MHPNHVFRDAFGILKQYALLAVALSTYSVATADTKYFVQKDSCWGEQTSFEANWKAKRDIPLYSVPATRGSPVEIGTIKRGTSVTRNSCDVEGMAGHYVVRKAEGRFTPGDDVWLYAYVGEGLWEITINGEQTEADFSFSAWDDFEAQRCAFPDCWGGLESPMQFTEWLQITTSTGKSGWIKRSEK